MKRIKEINERLKQIALKTSSGLTSYHDILELIKEKDELEDELKVLIKTIK